MMFFDAEVSPDEVESFSQQLMNGVMSFSKMNWSTICARLLSGLLGVLVMYVLVKWLDMLIGRALNRNNRMGLLGNFLRKLVRWICFVCIGIWFVSHLGLDMKPLIAGIGVTGVVLGFALQETIGNFFSGLMIIINHPFNIGDYIESGSFSGTVTDMDMNRVELLTPDNKRITMSNKLVWGNPVVNYSAMDKRRVDMTASAAYGSDISKAKKVLADLVMSYPEVLPSPAPTVEVGSLGDSEINFIVRPWVKPSDYWTVMWRFQGQWYDALINAGIDVPYDQLDIHIVPPDKE
ncbi:MAG: mechanosensitive ion channel family protein [Sphaerochaetaceae bacterium]|nr:mechanosensitive ion channel family protein [Spirochaetales bacterium]MDY5499659.1 mechanosensitive ion channel family protein [Sphaerochaetaceae bacterium]